MFIRVVAKRLPLSMLAGQLCFNCLRAYWQTSGRFIMGCPEVISNQNLLANSEDIGNTLYTTILSEDCQHPPSLCQRKLNGYILIDCPQKQLVRVLDNLQQHL
jgi:hypothetical protein